MTFCKQCGDVMFLWRERGICGKCRNFVKQIQNTYANRPFVAPQPVYVQQPVYYPAPQPQQYGYPQPSYQQAYPNVPYGTADYQTGLIQAGQLDRRLESIPNYGPPPTADMIQEDRVFHWVYFLCFGMWLLLAAAVFVPFVYLALIFKPGRVLFAAAAGYW